MLSLGSLMWWLMRRILQPGYGWQVTGRRSMVVGGGDWLKIEPFSEGQFDTEVNSYIIETEGGIVTTVLGSATDKQLSKIDPVGSNIFIEYLGKKTLKDGRSVNLFNVDVW
ncbi:hypothetical protein ES708_21722 [subsurface metagenome]